PGDGRIVRAVEAAVPDALAHRLVQVGDQPVVEGNAGAGRDIALRAGEGHVYAACVAPFRDDAPALEDQPIDTAAWPRGADNLVPGRRLEMPAGCQLLADVHSPVCLMREREIDGG